MRAILYARVSTRGQAEKGFSLRQQFEALREHAEQEGYEVVAEVEDPAQSGATLRRPGMDRVRDLVAAGGVDLVLAQDRDRIAREPAYHYLLRKEFEEHGCKIQALNDRGDESPEGELTDGILDQLAKYERAKTTERMRRGKLRKAREGKVLPSRQTPFGFQYRDGELFVDEGRMALVRKAFRMVAEGKSIRAVKRVFDEAGVPTPRKARTWQDSTIRHWLDSDAYKPYTYEEVRALVAPEVAAKLDPEGLYGIYWYDRQRTTKIDGRHIRKDNARETWIAVPIPDAGIPKEHVEKARSAVADNVRPPDAGRRFWELKSLLFCPCGRRKTTFTSRRKYKTKVYETFHHVCPEMRRKRMGGCEHSRYHTAHELEGRVRAFVLSLLGDPETMRGRVEEDVKRERERLRNSERESVGWFEELGEVERKRDAYIEMRADGDISREQYREKVAALDARKAAAERELERLEASGAAEHAKALDALPGLVEEFLRDLPSLVGDQPIVRDYETVPAERTEDNPLGAYTLAPECIRDRTEQELAAKRREAERRRGERFRLIYEALELRAVVHRDGTLVVSGTFGVGEANRLEPEDDEAGRCPDERGPRRTLSRGSSRLWP